MSVYEKFLDKNKSKLCESKSKKVSLKKLKRVNESDEIIDELKDFEPDIMENIYHKKQVFKDAAEYTAKSNGYVYYNTMYGNEKAICINVKGRPNINVDIPDDMYEIAQDYIDTYISDLADSLHEEDKDFVICGRSGGYWGYTNFEEHIVISDKGYKVLKDKVIELMKDEDKADWTIYDIVVNHLEELGDLLDASHLTLSKDFLEKLEDLSSIIDTNEKIINDELKEMMENEGVNESCGKRKPKKPFPRKSLKESAKDRFLKKVFGRSKLSESRTLKRTRKIKVPMNEATVNYLLRFTADGIKAGCLIGTKKDIDSIKRIYKNKSFKEIETYRLKSSDEETMYYQMEKLANSVKGKKGVDVRKTNDGKIGAIYFTDDYKGSEYKKILD